MEEEALTTKEVCIRLGLDHDTVMSIVSRYRNELNLERKGVGTQLLWRSAAVEFVRKIAAERVPRFRMRHTAEAKKYESVLNDLKRHISQVRRLQGDLEQLHRDLRANPASVGTEIHTLPHPDWALVKPVSVIVGPTDRGLFRAYLAEVDLWGEGTSRQEAVSSPT